MYNCPFMKKHTSLAITAFAYSFSLSLHDRPSNELPISHFLPHATSLQSPPLCTPSSWKYFCMVSSLLSTTSATIAIIPQPKTQSRTPKIQYTWFEDRTGISLLALRWPARVAKSTDGDGQCTLATNSTHTGKIT